MDETIEQYTAQIKQVEDALKLITSEEDKKELLSLRDDLYSLLHLTKECNPPETKKDEIDDEFDLFMSEIKQLDTHNSDIEQTTATEDNIVGEKYSAPHIHSWGGKSYHNAMICEDNRSENGTVKVLFTNPTHQEMIPCNFYLDGHCRFDESKCRYSHGEEIVFSEIKQYKEPDFSLLRKPNCLVLFRMDDKLWHKGIIKTVDFENKNCTIKLQQKNSETNCDFEFILPMETNDEENDSLSSDTEESEEEDDDYKSMRDIRLIEQSLMTVPTDRLGRWEEYTTGIGSRLMEKMGYIIGTGLGKNGEGIITPISAQILPQGRSLDYCMNLREQANGDKNLFSVEKKLKRLQDRQKEASIKAYEREKNKTDIFDFINQQLFTNPQTPSTSSATSQQKSTTMKHEQLKNQTTKNLNVADFEISENIRKKEKEISLLTQSLKRHKEGTQIYKGIKSKLDSRNLELMELKDSERCIKTEQNVRSNKNKLAIF